MVTKIMAWGVGKMGKRPSGGCGRPVRRRVVSRDVARSMAVMVSNAVLHTRKLLRD